MRDRVREARIEEVPTERQRPVLPDRVFRVVSEDGSEVIVHVEIQVRPEAKFEVAPLALWSAPEPELLVDQVVDRIAALEDLDQQTVLVELAILKGERIALLIRDALRRRNMSNVLDGTELGRELLARGEARGEARGRAQTLSVMLAERFGEAPGVAQIAASLAAEGDIASTLKRIREADTLQDLAD